MKSTNQFLVNALHVIVYIIFILLAIEAGSLLINFLTTIFKPEWSGYLHEQLNLSILLNENKWAFYSVFSFVIILALLKAYLFYLVILLMQKFDIEKPFSKFVANQITTIAYYTFSIGIISHIANQTSKNLIYHHQFTLDRALDYWVDGRAFLLMAAVIYIISIIFNKGIALQEENDLTV